MAGEGGGARLEETFVMCETRAQEEVGDDTAAVVHVSPSARYLLFVVLCESVCYHTVWISVAPYYDAMLGGSHTAGWVVAMGLTLYAFLASLLCGYIADSYLGRRRAVLALAVAYIMGLALITATSLPFNFDTRAAAGAGAGDVEFNRPHPKTSAEVGLFAGLAVYGFAAGGLKALLPPFYGDQIATSNAQLYGPAFRWYLWVLSIGALIGVLFMPMVAAFAPTARPQPCPVNTRPQNGSTPAPCVAVHTGGGGDPGTEPWNGTVYWGCFVFALCVSVVMVATFQRASWRFVSHPHSPRLAQSARGVFAYERKSIRQNSAIEAAQPLKRVSQLHNAILSDAHRDWALDVRVFSSLARQLLTVFPVYAVAALCVSKTMYDLAWSFEGPSWLAPTHLLSLPPMLLTAGIPIIEVNIFRKCIKYKIAVAPLARVRLGMWVVLGGLLWLIGVLVARACVAADVKLSVFWLLPLPLVLAYSELLALAGGMEYSYTKAAPRMKGLSSAVFQFTRTLGGAVYVLPLVLDADATYRWAAAGAAAALVLLVLLLYTWDLVPSGAEIHQEVAAEYEMTQAAGHDEYGVSPASSRAPPDVLDDAE